MSTPSLQFHKIWIEQCAAAADIRERFGLENALDYLIGEKLLSFLQASEQHPEFAAELPAFLAEIRRLFTSAEIYPYLDHLETKFLAPPEPDLDFPSTVYEIVGVVADTKYDDFRRETPPMAFGPAPQYPALGPWAAMLIHSSVPPEAGIATVKRLLRERHPEMVVEFSVFESRVKERFGQERLMAMVSGFFGLLAALLAVIGLYGLISYIVTRRRHEIGIRAALGAQPRDLRWLVLRDTLLLALIGIAVGLPAVLLSSRLASSLPFGITATDQITIASSTLLLVGAAILSGYLPARRAAKVNPIVALRYE